MYKMKKLINMVSMMSLTLLAASAVTITGASANIACWYYFGQDKLHEQAKALRRF